MRFLLLVCLAIGLIPSGAFAQDSNAPSAVDCSTFVNTTLSEAATACTGIQTNRGCFAHGPLEVTTHDNRLVTLGLPGYTMSLDSLYALRSGALRPDTGDWGIATLRVPVDADGHDLFMVLTGSVEMRNSCSALLQQAVQLTRETDLRVGPGSNYASLGRLPIGAELQVNACNCTGNWLRAIAPDQQTGWIWAGSIEGAPELAELPVVGMNTPVYGPMQAFCIRTGAAESPCSGAAEDGLLIQSSDSLEEARLQINQIELGLTSTAFVQSQPDQQFTLEVIDGTANVTLDGFTLEVPRGFRAVVPLNAENRPDGPARLELFNAADVERVPVELLPVPVDLSGANPDTAPAIVGVETCQVATDESPTTCRVHFVNADAGAIQRLDVEFVSAPQGDWAGSIHPNPALLEGDRTSGILAWEATCSVGSSIFVGPIVWQLTLTDDQGHRSLPFVASFNCG